MTNELIGYRLPENAVIHLNSGPQNNYQGILMLSYIPRRGLKCVTGILVIKGRYI